MTIQAASVLVDGTIAVTGGTATALTSMGNTLNEHSTYYGGTDYLSRNTVSFKVKAPKVSASAPNGYTQARNEVLVKSPLVLDNGNLTNNTVRIIFSCDVETTDAEKVTLLETAAQMISDSDFANYWAAQSLE